MKYLIILLVLNKIYIHLIQKYVRSANKTVLQLSGKIACTTLCVRAGITFAHPAVCASDYRLVPSTPKTTLQNI